MALALANLRSRVYALLNASTTYGTNDDTARWTQGEVDAALVAADGSVIEAICLNKNHTRRKAFLTGSTSNVGHGDSLASRIGPLESVTFVVTGGSYAGTYGGIEWPTSKLEDLERENRNPDALTSLKPHFILDGDSIWHNKAGLLAGGASGVSVNVTFCVYSNTGALQGPDEYEDAVVALAAKMIRAKEGAHGEVAGMFGQWGDAWLQWVRTEPSGPRPTMEMPEAA